MKNGNILFLFFFSFDLTFRKKNFYNYINKYSFLKENYFLLLFSKIIHKHIRYFSLLFNTVNFPSF